MIGYRPRFTTDADQVHVLTYADTAVQARLRWDDRNRRWRVDFSTFDGDLIVAGLAMVPGIPLLGGRRFHQLPAGLWLVDGPEVYDREDLGQALTLTFVPVERGRYDFGWSVRTVDSFNPHSAAPIAEKIGITRDELTDDFPVVPNGTEVFPAAVSVFVAWRGAEANPGTDSTIFSWVQWSPGDRRGIRLDMRSTNQLAARVFYGPNTAFSRFSSSIATPWDGREHRAVFRIDGPTIDVRHADGAITDDAPSAPGVTDDARLAAMAQQQDGSNTWAGSIVVGVYLGDVGLAAAAAFVDGTTSLQAMLEGADGPVLSPVKGSTGALIGGELVSGAQLEGVWALEPTNQGLATDRTNGALGGMGAS